MPVIKTHTSTTISPENREALKAAYGEAIATVPGKSEQWLMCLFDDKVPMYFAGSDAEPCALIEVSVYARSEIAAEVWERMTELITPVVASTLGIDPAHIYISYGSTPNFGWNGANF